MNRLEKKVYARENPGIQFIGNKIYFYH